MGSTRTRWKVEQHPSHPASWIAARRCSSARNNHSSPERRKMQTPAFTTLSNDVASIAKQASQSTVAFRHRGRWFSGFYWRTDVIATAAELVRVKPSENIAVLTPSQENVEGTLIGQHLSTDLAL